MPNTEDINKDNTLNETDAYYEYHAELNPENMNFNNPYITECCQQARMMNWYPVPYSHRGL
ncbi:MAG: hypothetical protein MZV63_13170 [Marinilabiliales bacterium]|nr:hypothetical protein [Marinilabiliales bacterium]